MSYAKEILCAGLGLASLAVTAADERLVFPPETGGASPREFRLVPERVVDLALLDQVDGERMASELLALLALPSRSCQETLYVAEARRRLEEAGKSLGLAARVDDLPARFAALPGEQRRDLSCNNGKTPPEVGNLIASVPGDPRLPSWHLSVHVDTNQLRFDGIRRQGDLIVPPPESPLGADDKAGMAIVLEILRVLAASGVAHGPLYFSGMVAEEDGAVGAQLIEAGAMTGDIIVSVDGGDPTEVAHAAPTSYGGHVTVRTQTSHPAAIDEKMSVSACAVGAAFLDRAGFRPDGHPPGRPDVVLHSYFVSCGIDRGRVTDKGHPAADFQYNTISPYWTAAWQLRSLEGAAAAAEQVAGIRATLAAVCEEAARGRTPVACDMAGTEQPSLTGYVVAEDAPSVRLLVSGFGHAGNTPRRNTQQFGGFNGNYIKQRFDREMILVGTGGDQAHTNQETLSIPGMVLVTRSLLAAMLESWRYEQVR